MRVVKMSLGDQSCLNVYWAAFVLCFLAIPAHSAITFAGDDVTFEVSSLRLNKVYQGELSFADRVPETVSLALVLNTGFAFCSDGFCGGDPDAGQEFVSLPFSRVGNQLFFEVRTPQKECYAGDCNIYMMGGTDRDYYVYLYREPFALVGDFSEQAVFTGSLMEFATAVPEPATWGLFILGFGAIGRTMRRRRHKEDIPEQAQNVSKRSRTAPFTG